MDYSTVLSRQVINQIHTNVNDPLMCSGIVMDQTVMGGLIMVLSNPDLDTVTSVLQIFLKFTEKGEHCSKMKDYIGMLDQLQCLMQHEHAVVADIASQIYRKLYEESSVNTKIKDSDRHREHKGICSHAPLREQQKSTNLQPEIHDKSTTKVSRRNSMLVRGGLNKAKSKVITLQIRGMCNKDDVELCRHLLLQVKGVISITFNVKRNRCTMRTTRDLKPELLAKAISKSMTMFAEHVVKDDEGNELMMSFGSNPSQVNKENEEIDYPVDEDSPVKNNGDALSRVQGHSYETPTGWGFFKSVHNYISNNLYW